MRYFNFGAKDFLKERIRIRNARKPSVIEVLILGLQNNAAPISDAAVPSEVQHRYVKARKKEEVPA